MGGHVYLLCWIEDGIPRANIYDDPYSLLQEQAEGQDAGLIADVAIVMAEAQSKPGESIPYKLNGWDEQAGHLSYRSL